MASSFIVIIFISNSTIINIIQECERSIFNLLLYIFIYVNVSDQTLYMSDCHQSQFKKLKSYGISGRSEHSEDIQ